MLSEVWGDLSTALHEPGGTETQAAAARACSLLLKIFVRARGKERAQLQGRGEIAAIATTVEVVEVAEEEVEAEVAENHFINDREWASAPTLRGRPREGARGWVEAERRVLGGEEDLFVVVAMVRRVMLTWLAGRQVGSRAGVARQRKVKARWGGRWEGVMLPEWRRRSPARCRCWEKRLWR